MFRWNRQEAPEDGLPPQEVRLKTLAIRPWEDDPRRARVSVEITPFLQPPNLEFSVTNAAGQEVASIYMVEVIDARLTFTMHLRDGGTNPPYQVQGRVQYEEHGIVDEKSATLLMEGDPPEQSA